MSQYPNPDRAHEFSSFVFPDISTTITLCYSSHLSMQPAATTASTAYHWPHVKEEENGISRGQRALCRLSLQLNAITQDPKRIPAESCSPAEVVLLQLTPYHVLCRLSQQLNALTEDAERMPANQQGAAEDMSGLVDGIMHQLLAKDVLYQPIQEIGSRYPQWLEEHRYDTSSINWLDCGPKPGESGAMYDLR